ncbi:hypothetical protein D3C78_1786810 [compost metagenome]
MTAELERLTRELGELGIAHSFPHPYFNQFSQALARNPIMSKRNFSSDDILELENVTDELLQDLIDGKGTEDGQ